MKHSIYAVLAVMALLLSADAAFAQEVTHPKYTGVGAGIGMGLAIVGAGVGIGLVGFAALSGIARQPEQAGTLRGTMILLAALVEGAALIAVVFCLVLALIAS